MHDVDPLSERRMETHYRGIVDNNEEANNVICCVLADIYHNIEDPRLRLQCQRAATMAKRMQHKLWKYKYNKEK